MIYSERVWNGGASRETVKLLWHEDQLKKEDEMMKKLRKGSSRGDWRI